MDVTNDPTNMNPWNSTNTTNEDDGMKCLGRETSIHPIALIIYIIVNLVLQITTALSNGVFLLVMCSKKVKLSPTGILVINLTIADLVIGFIIHPMVIYIRYFTPLYEQWNILQDNVHQQKSLCFTTLLLGISSYVGSFCLLAAIAFERFIGMMLYRSLDKKRAKIHAIFGGLFIWVYSFTLLIVLFPKYFTYDPNLGCHLTLSVSPSLKEILKTHLIIPLILCIIFYIAIFFTIRKHRRTVHSEAHTNPVNSVNHIHEARWVVTIFLVLVVFYGTWIPYLMTITYIDDDDPCMVSWKKNFIYCMTTLAYVSSLMNPWIYTYRHPAYRRQLRQKIRKIRQFFRRVTIQDS